VHVLAEFFEMGGYARYVWSAWGISAAALIATVVLTHASLRSTQAKLRRRLQSSKEHTT